MDLKPAGTPNDASVMAVAGNKHPTAAATEEVERIEKDLAGDVCCSSHTERQV